MKKMVYSFDPSTFIYQGETTAHEDPFCKGSFLNPAHSTEIKPPLVSEDKVAIFDPINNEWKIINDHRGIYFHKITLNRIQWNVPNKSPSEEYTSIPPQNLIKPKWDDQTNKWIETVVLFDGTPVETKDILELLVQKKIKRLGEDKVKTLKIIALSKDTKCVEWDNFLKERDKILKEKDKFLKDHQDIK